MRREYWRVEVSSTATSIGRAHSIGPTSRDGGVPRPWRRFPMAVWCGLVTVLVVSGCQSDKPTADSTVAAQLGSTRVAIGEARVASTDVVVDGVAFPAGGGFVAVYSDSNGGPGVLLAASSKQRESSKKVTVAVPAGSSPRWVMVHFDGDGDGRFEFPGPDGPVSDPSTGSVLVRRVS